jgi:DNA-binding beta-propeller fold protein YncE
MGKISRSFGLRVVAAGPVLGVLAAALAIGIKVGTKHTVNETLPNNWRVTPAGDATALPGDLPVHMVTLGGDLLVSTNGFNNQGLCRLSLETGALSQSVMVGKTWNGLCLSPDGQTVYLSNASDSRDKRILAGLDADALAAQDFPIVRLLRAGDGTLSWSKGLAIPAVNRKNAYISGLACDSQGALYAANLSDDTIYKLGPDGSLEGSEKVGYRPYEVALAPDGKTLAVSNWGGRSVSLLNPETMKTDRTVDNVGDHPCDLKWIGNRLFVACSGGDNVAAIDEDGKVTEDIRVTPVPDGPKVGVTPCSLAVSKDGERLYVAESGVNCVGVVDTSVPAHSRVLGFIPTGWYPSSVAVSPDGRTLFVGVGKGITSRPNFPAEGKGVHQPDGSGKFDYIGTCLAGAVSKIALPDEAGLAAFTKQVVSNTPNPNRTDGAEDARTVADGKNALKKIKHVVYIIRENRTYDQVFGDVSEGNGDPNLTIFGDKITPNAHKLVEDGVLFDNFYCDGEVSEDGHQWCNAAYATDFTEKAWSNSYSNRGEPDADDRLTESPGGYLWDNCRKHGRTYRSYGELASFHSSPNEAPQFTGNKGLEGHASQAWSAVGSWSKRDTDRASVFIDELHEAEKTGEWPNFMVISLFEDHTQGLLPKAFTPLPTSPTTTKPLGVWWKRSATANSGRTPQSLYWKTMPRTGRTTWIVTAQWHC